MRLSKILAEYLLCLLHASHDLRTWEQLERGGYKLNTFYLKEQSSFQSTITVLE